MGRDGRASAKAMLFALAASALWGIAGFAFGVTGQKLVGLIHQIADPLRFGCWYAFLLLLLWPRDKGVRRPRLLAAVSIVVAASGVVMRGLGQPHFSLADEFLRALFLQSLVMAVLGLLLLEQLWRNATKDTLWSIKPICFGLGAAFGFDFYLYAEAVLFNRIDNDALSIRGLVYVIVVPLLALSHARSKGWVSRIRVSQKIVFHSASLVLAGLYLLFFAGVGYYVRAYGGDWGRALQQALFFAGFLVLVLLVFSRSIRAALRLMVGKHFFRYRYDYREEWLRFTQLLSERGSQEEVGQRVVRALADIVESPAGGLWLKDSQTGDYKAAARWNTPQLDVVESHPSSLCLYAMSLGGVLNVDEVRKNPERFEPLVMPAWVLGLPNAWLFVTLQVSEDVIGFVILTTPRTSMEVNWEVNDLLRTAGRQAATFLAQMQATEALLEARKFEAFNRMSAFVLHDLKNIVSQLSLMLRNAERHRDNPEFQRDMFSTVEHSVERMRDLMLQLRQRGQPAEALSGVALEAVIERLSAAKRSQGLTFDVEVKATAIVKGHDERIERVIGHALQNALDATEQGGKVEIKLFRNGEYAVVEIRDTGEGMTPEFVRERLFKPFQTTKTAGMGVGAYESSLYVRELGGRIGVQSEVMVGTTITMWLPLLNSQANSSVRNVNE